MAQPERPRDDGLSRRWPPERRSGLLRLALGILQLFGASLALVLLLQAGLTREALVVAAATGLCTTTSVLLFGLRHLRS